LHSILEIALGHLELAEGDRLTLLLLFALLIVEPESGAEGKAIGEGQKYGRQYISFYIALNEGRVTCIG